MFSGGTDPIIYTPNYSLPETRGVIESFVAKAARYNVTLDSDYEAEANIEIAYKEALGKLQKMFEGGNSAGSSQQFDDCLSVLKYKAAQADLYRDGIFKAFVNPSINSYYVPPSERSFFNTVAGNLTMSVLTLGLLPVGLGLKGYWEQFRHS